MTDLNSGKLKVNNEKFPPSDWVETTLGFIPKDWKIIPANEFCEKVADGTHDSPKQSQDGKLLITSKNLKNGQLETSSAYLISQKDFEEVNKRSKVDQWDILLSMIGTVGEVCLISEEPDFAIKNVGLFKCGNKSNAKWLYYFLRSSIGQNHLLSRLNGTTQKYITLSELRNFPIIVPTSPAEQVAIASILSAFDDKIELLREQNKTLEEMGQTLFNEKCIVKNEKLPEGWRIGKVKDIVDIFDSQRIPLSSNQRQEKQGKYPYHGATSIMDYIDEYLFDGIYLLLAEDGSVMDQNGYPVLQYVWDKFWVNNHTHVLQGANGFSTEMLYLFFKNTKIAGIVNGAVQLKINQTNLMNLEVIIPDQETLKQFDEAIQPIFAKIRDNSEQIQSLSKSRDELLPRLMRGEVRASY